MKKLVTLIAPLLLSAVLTACGPTATKPPTPPPLPIATLTPIPTGAPLPEIGELVVDIDAEVMQETCAGYDPIVGGMVTVTVTTEDGNMDGIGKVEFFVEGELIDTVTEPPFMFEGDATIYDDGTELTLRADVYTQSDTLAQSESVDLQIDITPEPTLKEFSEQLDIEIGAYLQEDVSNWQIPRGEEDYINAFCQNFTFLINHTGMWETQVQQGEWNFVRPDKLVEFAEANNLKIRGFPLIYGENLDWLDPDNEWTLTPRWVHRGDFSREEMIAIMYEQIETTMTRYKGQINEWVVVNEAFGGFDGQYGIHLKETIWTEKLGDDYVDLAFKHARQVDPNATLILNEVGVDYLGAYESNRVDGFYLFVQDLLEKGTPIDAVGFQFHWVLEYGDNPTLESIVENFARYGELGLDVYITEMDVALKEPITEESLEEQARLYAIALQACLESEYCKSYTVWGYSDRHNWYQWFDPDFKAPDIFDENVSPKPAFYALIQVLQDYLADH